MKYDFSISCNQNFKTNQHKWFPSFFFCSIFCNFFLLPMFMKKFIHFHFPSTFPSINIVHPWTHGKNSSMSPIFLSHVSNGCKYIESNQWDYFTKGLWILFSFFSFFHMKEFFNEIFCNFLFKIHIVAPLNHMFCVNHCRINMFFSKCVNFAKFCTSSWKFIIILNHAKICKLL